MGVLCSVRGVGGRAPLRWLTLLFSLALPLPGQAVDLEREVTVDIAAQPLAAAAIEFGRQTGIQVVTAGADLTALSSPGVSGTHRLGEALRRLLRGTGMEFKSVGEVTVALVSTVGTIPLPREEPEDVVHLDSMIVTAGKREQNINEVAGSVAALSGDMLEKIGAQSFEDYLKLVPGVTVSRYGADASKPVIRGIATDSGFAGYTARTTGIFVDEIPLNDLFYTRSIIDMNPFDLERVEVMKGPQGTLFGSSAISGAIRYITHKPELNLWQSKLFGSYTSIEQGNQKAIGAGMVNVPIGQSAAIRAVGLYRESPRFVDDLYSGIEDAGDQKQTGARVLGRWLPTEQLSLTATWLAQETDQNGYEFADQRERLERSGRGGSLTRNSQVTVANLVATYDFDWGTLLSNSSHVTKYADHISEGSSDRAQGVPDGSGTEGIGLEDQPVPLTGTGYSVGALDGFTQELRVSSPEGLGRWQWQAGAAYLRFDQQNEYASSAPFLNATLGTSPADPFQPPLFPVGTPLGSIAGQDDTELSYAADDSRATEAAAFGEITGRFWDSLDVTLGGRYFQTLLVADTVSRGFFQSALTPGQPSAEGHDEIKERGFNPKLSARYLMNDNVNLYALVAKGFQFGGIQLFPYSLAFDAVASGQAGPKFVPFKSSTLWNYEIGARTEWWGGRLQFDATVFHMVWRDLQLIEIVAVQGVGVVPLYSNIGKATSSGVEMSFRVMPVRGLSWLSSAGWTNAVTAIRVANSGLDVPKGTQMPGAARFQMANTLSYDAPFSLLGEWTAGLGLTHTYTSRIFRDIYHSAEYGDYALFDASLHLLNTDFSWQPDLVLSVTNLLDNRAVAGMGGCNVCRFQDIYFVRPRTGTLSLQVRF